MVAIELDKRGLAFHEWSLGEGRGKCSGDTAADTTTQKGRTKMYSNSGSGFGGCMGKAGPQQRCDGEAHVTRE